jgi:hypothetical protein
MDTEYTVSYLFILFIQSILTVKFAINDTNKCILVLFISPTDALVSSLKKNKIKISIKTAPTCFGAVTPSSGGALTHWHTTFYNTWRTYKY